MSVCIVGSSDGMLDCSEYGASGFRCGPHYRQMSSEFVDEYDFVCAMAQERAGGPRDNLTNGGGV